MTDLESLFSEYARYHRDPRNKATHYLGIPAIALALLGLGAKVELLPLPGPLGLDVGVVLSLFLLSAYLRWHRRLALGTFALLVPLYLVGRPIPTPWLWGLLAVGVGLQYLGHLVFERNTPAFHTHLVQTLVGPLWVAAALLRAVGVPGIPAEDPATGVAG